MSAFTDNLPDLSQGYCVLDCETTGLDPFHDRVIEVCLVSCRKFGETEARPVAHTALVKSVEKVPEHITQITGITTEMLHQEGQVPEYTFKVLFRLGDLVNPDPPLPVVGHNIIGFDRQFLLQEARRQGAQCLADASQVLDPGRLIDTGALYKGIRLGYEPFPGECHYEWACRIMDVHASGLYWNLAAAAAGCGVPFSQQEPHRARADAVTCQRVFEKILQEEAKR